MSFARSSFADALLPPTQCWSQSTTFLQLILSFCKRKSWEASEPLLHRSVSIQSCALMRFLPSRLDQPFHLFRRKLFTYKINLISVFFHMLLTWLDLEHLEYHPVTDFLSSQTTQINEHETNISDANKWSSSRQIIEWFSIDRSINKSFQADNRQPLVFYTRYDCGRREFVT